MPPGRLPSAKPDMRLFDIREAPPDSLTAVPKRDICPKVSAGARIDIKGGRSRGVRLDPYGRTQTF